PGRSSCCSARWSKSVIGKASRERECARVRACGNDRTWPEDWGADAGAQARSAQIRGLRRLVIPRRRLDFKRRFGLACRLAGAVRRRADAATRTARDLFDQRLLPWPAHVVLA